MRKSFQLFTFFGLLIATLGMAACAPSNSNQLMSQTPNETGFRAADGKEHTGAGPDKELSKIKAEIGNGASEPESLAKADRELAAQILYARMQLIEGAKPFTRIDLLLKDDDKITFDFTDVAIATRGTSDSANDVRYKAVIGKDRNGQATLYEAAMLCRKSDPKAPNCKTATISLRDKRGGGARAGLVVRHQDVTVLAKSPQGSLGHTTLKRLLSDFKTAKAGKLQTFEVAWGPSGFALSMGDAEVCPVGRLVETNDLDEPLRLNCPGVAVFRDLEGRMMGNTTRGELFLEINATIHNMIFPDKNENLYLLVRQKREPKKPATPVVQPPGSPSAPATPVTPTTPATPTEPDDDEDPEADEPIFQEEIRPDPITPTAPSSKGWLIQLDMANPITKTWARDRKNPIIDKGVKDWLTNSAKSSTLKNFAIHFMPNRDLVRSKLAQSGVPAEFGFITLIESAFFKRDGYPVEGPKGSSAYGPWQFLDLTAKNNGLKIFARGRPNGKFVDGNICDDRADLAKATEGAGRYLRSIIKMFPHDPKLVILGYNQGEFGVQRNITKLKNGTSEARLKAIEEVGLSFWAIRRFNMARAGGLHYVEMFVSIYHAALEMEPVALDKSIAPWKPNPACR